MGLAHSGERHAPASREELTKQLADKFARKCFTPLELYSFRDVFYSHASHGDDGHRYWGEHTIARFLEIPDTLGVSAVLFQMISYIGAFPFLEDAPAILGLDQMIVVITILSERYRRVLSTGALDRRKLFFRSLAGHDRELIGEPAAETPRPVENSRRDGAEEDGTAALSTTAPRTPVAELSHDDEYPNHWVDDDDELVHAALESLGHARPSCRGSLPSTAASMIAADNWRKLLLLLLLVAPLDSQENLSLHFGGVARNGLERLRAAADCVLSSFLDVEQAPGIDFSRFDTVTATSMPFVFKGLGPLFERLLFSKNLTFHPRQEDRHRPPDVPSRLVQQPLWEGTASIMNDEILSQISFFIPGSSLFRRLRLLYSGEEDGFSMGSFESKVFNWRAPTILLVSGNRIQEGSDAGHTPARPASAFLASLPPRRFPPGNRAQRQDELLTFGVYLSQPWKHTRQECFGTEDTLLFQLQPFHDVFHASAVNKDYASFAKPSVSVSVGGISFGCPPPPPGQAYRRSNVVSLGPVSLVLDSSFEFACFTHDYMSQGGAFHTSVARKFDFQDRLEILSIEVWGCGGGEEAEHQAERWAWEAREAEARRKINIGSGDTEADRALLEMVGLVGANRSGGSMG